MPGRSERVDTPRALSRAELRELDRLATERFGIPALLLMENAGAGAARCIEAARARWGLGARAAIVCGSGNNGADGAVVARHLDGAGWEVEVVYAVAGSELRAEAAAQRAMLDRAGLRVRALRTAAELDEVFARHVLLVDALLGTGAKAPPRDAVAECIRALLRRKSEGARVVSLDLPSGLDADTGDASDPAVRADLTVTFAAEKLGFAIAGARVHTGPIEVVSLGLPRAVFQALGGA